jgi:hypothetical protein
METLWWCLHFKSIYDMVVDQKTKAFIMIKLLMFLTVLTMQSCLKDDVLVLKRKQNNTGKIKFEGYFLYRNNSGLDIYFLYQNGLVLQYWSRELKDSLLIEDGLTDLTNLNNLRKLKDRWGIYTIEENRINIEKWYPSDKPLETYLKTGNILNDSTFLLNTVSEPDGSKKEVINEVYRFRKFSPKPDSTNMFIK